MLLLKVHGFRYYSTLICLALCAIFSLWSFINAKFIIRIKRIYIKLRSAETGSATIGTPRLTIAAISDIHISESTKPKTIRALFNKVALLNADIIVIVGDLIDTNILNNICASDDCSDYGFDLLKAKYGVYAVSGNHDYYTGLRVFIKLCEKYNITVLNNTSTLVSAGANSVGGANHGGANGIINIAGIHDSNWKRPKVIRNAICGSDKNYPVLFLSHRPEAFRTAKEIDEYNIIQVSGHTHVGQVPPIEIARSFMKYNYGLYKCNGNTMYVSSGARFWGPPVRFASMGEIALITLENSGCRSSSG
jgi:predicted MPP superfamily phosphohydrolase